MTYISEVIANVVMPPISDVYGRKNFIYGGLIIQLIIYILLLSTSSYKLVLVLIFIFGPTTSIRMFITYTHMMEIIPPTHSAFFSDLVLFLDGLIFIISPILVMIFKNTSVLIYCALILGSLSLVSAILIRQQESVKFCLSRGRYAQAKVEAMKACEINKCSEE